MHSGFAWNEVACFTVAQEHWMSNPTRRSNSFQISRVSVAVRELCSFMLGLLAPSVRCTSSVHQRRLCRCRSVIKPCPALGQSEELERRADLMTLDDTFRLRFPITST